MKLFITYWLLFLAGFFGGLVWAALSRRRRDFDAKAVEMQQFKRQVQEEIEAGHSRMHLIPK